MDLGEDAAGAGGDGVSLPGAAALQALNLTPSSAPSDAASPHAHRLCLDSSDLP